MKNKKFKKLELASSVRFTWMPVYEKVTFKLSHNKNMIATLEKNHSLYVFGNKIEEISQDRNTR